MRTVGLFCFGLLLPVGCLWADPTSFRETYFPGYEKAVIGFLAAQMTCFAAWLAFGKRRARGSWPVGLFLLLGSAAALFIGFVLLPLTVLGAFLLIGLLGFVPFGTAWAYYRLGCDALSLSEKGARALGCALAFGVAGAAWGAHAVVHRGPDLDGLRSAAEPLVRAVYAFRQKHGLWPERLTDVQPTIPGWVFDGRGLRHEVAWKAIPFDKRGILVYSFWPQDEGWRLQEREAVSVLGGKLEGVPATARTPEHEPFVVAELERRIRREPGEIQHGQFLVSYLRERGRREAAAAAAEACARSFPRHWWPALASADLARRREDLADWVRRHPRFTTPVYLFQYDATAGDASAALEDIRSALRFSYESHPDDAYTESWYLYVMGIYAYERGEFALAIEVCERGASWKEASLGFVRAASRLALGEVDASRQDLEAAQREKGAASLWVGDVEPLSAAVRAGDRAFRLALRDRMPLRLYRSPD